MTDPRSPVPGPDTAIAVRNLSKSFKMYASPKERLKELLHPLRKKYHREFWALRDLSFEVKKGSTFGIIGENGSGKSTLLQVLTGIMRPTAGSARINGRVSALLELGAGFNKEFTGRENVFMQGAIMDIDKKEMARRFDEIAAFADIGDFIDQPARTYSSGMYIRLAFACAVNVDPEVLIIDEALSVGDDMFKRRCYRKIEEFKKQGKTIIFVSHALPAIAVLCDRAMLLDKGRLVETGEPKEVLNTYSKLLGEKEIEYAKRPVGVQKREVGERGAAEPLKSHSGEHRYGAGDAEIVDVKILNEEGEQVPVLETCRECTFKVKVHFKRAMEDPVLDFLVKTPRGVQAFGMSTSVADRPIGPVKAGTVVEAEFSQRMLLRPAPYSLSVSLEERTPAGSIMQDNRLDVVNFNVVGKRIGSWLVNMGVSVRLTTSTSEKEKDAS